MATSLSPASGIQCRPTFACLRCAGRKVKCDRTRPCGACTKHKVDCVFQTMRPPSRRRRRLNDQTLIERPRSYESLLREKGISIDNQVNSHSPCPVGRASGNRPDSNHGAEASAAQILGCTQSSPTAEHNHSVSRPHVLQGKGGSMFVNNSLWSRIAEEFQDSDDGLRDNSEESSEANAVDHDFHFVLCNPRQDGMRPQHPPSEKILQLWHIFGENVDPLTKVVHVPTLGPSIDNAAMNTSSISRGLEALMFAIYSAAVMSLQDEECKRLLGGSKGTFLARYTKSTKAALSRANFMSTTDIVVLQALILHLLSIRGVSEPRAVWSLSGVAVRIARGMGLERDGIALGLPPFETEIRRRIWWQLKSLDYQTAELCGLSKFRELESGPGSTNRPAYANDDQLQPGMTSVPTESSKLTDTAFVALKYELLSFGTSLVNSICKEGSDSSQWERHVASEPDRADSEAALRKLEDCVETRYLRYCDPSQPLHLMTMLFARCAVNTVKFMMHHPRRWNHITQMPADERQFVWKISLSLLKQHCMLQSSPQLEPFAWIAVHAMQWHSFIYLLDVLRAYPHSTGAKKAWRLVEKTYDNNPAMTTDSWKPIHVAVASLCLKAYDARTVVEGQSNDPVGSGIPGFIVQLRRHQETLGARRHMQRAGTTHIQQHIVPDLPTVLVTSAPPQRTCATGSDICRKPVHSEEPGLSLPSNSLSGGNGTSATGAFQGADLCSDFSQGNDGDMSSAYTLPQPESFDAVSWEQWDAWLADSNAMYWVPSDV